MTTSKFSLPVVVALIVGLLVGFALGAITYRGSSEDLAENSEEGIVTAGLEDDTASPSTEVKLTVADQVAGNQVVVSGVSLDKMSWVAVRDYQDGKPGNVLGARRLNSGDYEEGVVELLRPTVAGKSYAVVVFYDDGDLSFSSKKDIPVEEEGELVLATFLAE